MDITEDEFRQWKSYIRGIAFNICRKWAYLQSESLIDDCEGAGWEAIVKFGLDSPRIKWEIQNYIQDEISKALYGQGRKRRRKNKVYITSLDNHISISSLNYEPVEKTVINRDLIRKLYNIILSEKSFDIEYQNILLMVLKGMIFGCFNKDISQQDIYRSNKEFKNKLKIIMGADY